MITLAVDCMGGDHGPHVTLAACRHFLDAHPEAHLLMVGLPVGVGMSSDAVSAPGLSLRELLVSVSQSRMGNGADFAQTVQNGIDQYLPTVLDPSQVVLRSLTFTAAPGAQAGTLAQPIAISGAVGAGEGSLRHPGRAEALVIDTRGLPPGAVLQLDNVEFAIVLGACTVIGGAGAILQVETGRTRQVPAVIELLSGSGLRHAQTGQQCGTEKFLVHLQLLKKIRCKRNRRTCVLLEGSSFMYLDGHVLYAIPARLCAER